ncbi:ferroxidase fet3 [Coemansia sp. RSA 2598]|nr:ferroxidase fet3 [Coemansia sp. RSA 2598]
MLFSHCIALLVCLASCQAKRVVVDWNIGYVTASRDGYVTRKSIGVNGKLPVPPVHITQGDTLVLNVVNSLDQPTSVHAHGIFQRGTSYMDGAGMVTQCGIPPGANFTYEYAINQSGTYWIHGHYNHQNSEGLRTPLIVYDKDMDKLPMKYDEEALIYLEDWYAAPLEERTKEIWNPTDPTSPPPPYPSGLINGINGNVTQVVNMEPGKKYRFRVLNMGTEEWFKFSIPGHKMTVIEADGEYSDPMTVDGLDIGPGQRYSAIVQAMDSAEYNYIFNAMLYSDFIPAAPGLNPRYYTGLIQYKAGAPIKLIEPKADSKMEWTQDIKMQAYDRMPLLNVSRTVNTVAGLSLLSENQAQMILHQHPYMMPSKVPTLFSAMSMGELAADGAIYGPQTDAVVINKGEVIEILLTNEGPLYHTMHLHGHSFQVTEYGPAGNSSLIGKPPAPVVRSGPYPMRRDTFVVPAFQYARIRFLADNPGVWLFHCHMDIHFALGMAMTFIEAPKELQKTQHIPQTLKQMCLAQGLGASGNGAGNQGLDLTGLPALSE